jgi:hypothetical protein
LQHNSTGTPAANFGTGLNFRGADSTTTNQDMASIDAIWTAANHITHTSALTFSVDSTGVTTLPSERVRITGAGYVGVNTTTPAVSMDINGAYATDAANITLANGTNNNVALGNVSFGRITGPSAAFTITGIANGTNGKWLRLENTTSQNMTISNANASSSAANRILTNTGADILLKGNSATTVDFIYDATNSNWVMGPTNANQNIGPVGSINYMTKAADQSVTNSIALVADNDISFNTNANETWEIDGELHADNAAAGADIKICFTTPAGATMKIYYVATEDAVAGVPAVNAGASVLTASGVAKRVVIAGGTSTYIHVHGIFRNAGTGGAVLLKWAQNVAGGGGNSTILRQDSFIRAMRVN